ncbi:MAG: hypothetical protein ACYDG2_08750 [Ruminiclostridium sp.]
MRKVFVEVVANFYSDGTLTPKLIIWEDGRKYEINKVLEVKKAASLKVGGQGIRYKCRISGKDTCLFLEDGRWFVEGK